MLALCATGVIACGQPKSEVQRPKTAAPEPPSAPAPGSEHPPRIDSLALSPPSPRPGEVTVAEVHASGPEGDAVQLSYVWRVDGKVRPEQGASLTASGPRGTQIEVEVTPHDAQMSGLPMTASGRIGNQPPAIRAIHFPRNSAVVAGEDVVAEPEARRPKNQDCLGVRL